MDHYAHDVDVQPDSVDFPNTIMRRRTSTTQQDDTPDFSTKTGDEPDAPPTAMTGTESAAGDVDSCRICRGEGTPGEPLFYPCKCSGSIKYVHQDCLMEWLSHSQKKHCELCKTPFRFTKLYSPNMPQRLPFYVFSTHMAKYLVSNILVWLRGALVMSVWLGWLPYLMRSVWSFLFWISDEGFGPSHSFSSADAPSAAAHLSLVAFTMATQGLTSDTCPAGPLFPATTTAASKSDIAQQMPNLLRTAALPLHLNTSGVNSFTASLARLVFGGDALSVQRTWGESSNETNLLWSSPQHETLLSEVAFLKDLSPHPVINRIVIRIFEGQIITILVIICFILIILVRDYVVQQQPEINMRAAFAAQMDNVEQVQELPQAQLLPEGPIQANAALGDEHHSDGESARAIESMVAHDGEATDYLQATDRQGDVAVEEFRQRPIAEFRRRLTRRDAQEDAVSAPPTGSSSNAYGPLRGQLNSNVREHLLEALDEQSQSTVNQYLRVYRQANGDRERILQIIRDEGLEERLAYWVNATEAMPNLGSGTASDSIAGPNTDKLGSHAQPTHRPRQSEADTAEANGHGHILTTDMTQKSVDQSPPMSLLKGKQKAVEKDMEHSLATPESVGHSYWHQPNMHGGNSDAPIPDNSAPPAAPTRPRAVSDGPLIRDRINPLANNSWSFAAMPESESITHPTLQIAAPAFDQKMSPREGSPGSNWSDPFEIQEFGSDERTPFTQPQQFHDTLHAVEAGATLDMQPDTDADTHLDREIREEIATGLGDGAREAAAIPQPATLADRVADFLWGDIEAGTDGTGADALELFIDDPHAPFMELGHDHDDSDDEANEEDEGVAINEALPGGLAPEVLEAAAAAGIDPDAIEDAEDFDGVMELLGMRGPLAGLFQNAIFCAFLVSITIFLGVFLPYNIGRLAVWIAANPMRIVHMVLSFSRFVQDSCLFAVGWTASSMFDFLYMIAKFSHIENARILLAGASADARQLTMESLNRIWDSIVYETTFITSNEIRNFSVVSHEALITVKQHTSQVLSISARTIVFLLGGNYASKWETAKSITAETAPYALELAKNFSSAITRPNSWMINLNIPESATTFDPSLAYWGAEDRTLAIFSGYVSMSLLAGLYLGRGTPFSSGSTAQEWEASVIDVLNQASGVMKVILIISIEMLVFPLYCGLLLDFALLPLFESTSFKSRLLFTYNYPLTSIFVHWFVGTGYMFHFALFVSMCRKIMRKGVLYFIRDPDDPEFHPVRDVLERSVTTQLRKILFSAFVYGALVVVCLGGVVWGLSLTISSVLPIHYSSNEPVLEFPIDLLFYNFLMPLAVKFFKPSDGLHAMYTWWFRRCARALCLTWFLFGERRIDEEGRLQLLPESKHYDTPWYRKLLLQVNEAGDVVPKTWSDSFDDNTAKPTMKMNPDKMMALSKLKAKLVETEQLVPEGRFVRAPASDQVKVPKGRTVFLEVSDNDARLDDKPDVPEPDLYSSKNYQFVYVPTWFRVRISLFIFFIWMFAAITGVAFTILPLVCGRRMFKLLLPAHIRTNDIYAFSIGMYILGSLGYLIFHARITIIKARDYISSTASSMLDRETYDRVLKLTKDGARLAYTYTTLLIIFPLVVALIMEFYVMIPLRTWRYSRVIDQMHPLKDGHTISIVQAWTLGLLYLKIGTRILVYLGGRPAQAARAVLRRGWLDPDVNILTRAFVVPGFVLAVFLLAFPPVAAKVALRHGFLTIDPWSPEKQIIAFRMAYPIAALGWVTLWLLKGVLNVLERWRARVRDEAYLIGERLHNFGGMVGTGAKGAAADASEEWRGGARL